MRRPFQLFTIVLGLGAWLACSDDTSSETSLRQAVLAEGCSLNSDCTTPLVCAFQSCHIECTAERDCENGERCMEADRPVFVCQLPKEKNCTRNSDCAGRALCGPDGQCRDGCTSDRDCYTTYVCTAGVCAKPVEIVDGGLPAPAMPTQPEGTPCVHATECPGALVCVGGFCGPECFTSKDCFVSWSCLGSRCVPPEAQDASTR